MAKELICNSAICQLVRQEISLLVDISVWTSPVPYLSQSSFTSFWLQMQTPPFRRFLFISTFLYLSLPVSNKILTALGF